MLRRAKTLSNLKPAPAPRPLTALEKRMSQLAARWETGRMRGKAVLRIEVVPYFV